MTMDGHRQISTWERVLDLCGVLRGPEGCAWDRSQTPESLAPYLLEETHEVFEALACADPEKLTDEIGDAIYLWVFFLLVLEDAGRVSLPEAARRIEEKLVRRHPHVFGAAEAGTGAEAHGEWEQRKRLEHPDDGEILRPPPPGLPALARARRIQEKAAAFKFDWGRSSDVIAKIREETDELHEEIERDPRSPAVREELGDLLFALVNLARHLDQDPEATLIAATEKFRKRFNEMARSVEAGGNKMGEAPLDLMEAHWERIKSRTDDGTSPSGQR
jgi:MazG family protein